MRVDRHKGFAILLIVVGALILLRLIPGVNTLLQEAMFFTIPFAMVALGYYGIKRDKKVAGGIVFTLGLLGLIAMCLLAVITYY